ncbi:MAG: PASTA domain-containing protein [Desulfovibrio sp.]|nr:PASTA domain-containing protein [Desulfovibrio sp.]
MGLFRKKKVEVRKQGAEYVERPKRESLPKEELQRSAEKTAAGSGYDWSRFRIIFGAAVFCFLWVVLWGRALYLQVFLADELAARAVEQHEFTEEIVGLRGIISDRNGQVIARTVAAPSIFALPGKIQDKEGCARALSQVLGIEESVLLKRLMNTKRQFIYLKRKVDDSTAAEVAALHIPGIGQKTEYTRVYPFKHMAGQLLGFVDAEGKGKAGLEQKLDSRLSSPKGTQVVLRDAKGNRIFQNENDGKMYVGENIRLTLDMHVQYIAEEAVARAVREYDASWGGALVVDVKNGDILGWAQYPFFNPNSLSKKPEIYRNHLAQDALEPGSTFKPLVMALALQDRKVSPNTLIDCEGGRWSGKDFLIRDTSSQGVISASRVLRYSSNIGMAKIGLTIGTKRYYSYLKTLGFGGPTQIPVVQSRGILRSPKGWSQIDTITTSFGQSISVTGLQMAQAYLTLLNDGVYKPLRLLAEDTEAEIRPRAFSAETAKKVRLMMRDVVEAKDGTGKRGRIEGVEVAGKTGTAQKADHRSKTYGSKRLASFVGFFPAEKPEFLILVMVDEPTRNQFGGVVSAPVFSEIGARLLAYSGNTCPLSVKKEEERSAESPVAGRHAARSLKMASLTPPWEEKALPLERKKVEMKRPGSLAKAGKRIPDVKGKSLRNAVELFALGGIVPELKGTGNLVVRQFPAAGSQWPDAANGTGCVLWLSENMNQ